MSFRGNISHTYEYHSSPNTGWWGRLTASGAGSRKCSTAGPGCRATSPIPWGIHSGKHYGIWGASDGKRCVLTASSGGESKCRICGSGITWLLQWRIICLLEKNKTHKQTKLLLCSWALMERKYLTMKHQVNVQPELPIINCVSEPLSNKVKLTQRQSKGTEH